MVQLAIGIAILATYCNFYIVLAEDNMNSMSNGECGSLMHSLNGCCNIPKTLPRSIFDSCMLMVGKKGMVIHGRGRKNRYRDPTEKEGTPLSGMFDALLRFRTLRGQKRAEKSMCLMQCVMREQNLLTEEEDIDITKFGDKLLEIANDEWKPIVTEALSSCTEQMTAKDVSNIGTAFSNGQICKAGSVLFTTCIRRHLTLKCPESSLSTQVSDDTCPEKIEKLKNCDPFLLPGIRYVSTTTAMHTETTSGDMVENQGSMDTTMVSMDESPSE